MEMKDFINWLKDVNALFSVTTLDDGYELVYVSDRKSTELKRKNPRKYKDLYIPYIRVSDPGDHDGFYTRENGWCQYYPVHLIQEKILENYV